MTPIELVPIQYYADDDIYHYTTDNRPLYDLEQNDIILKEAIEAVSNNVITDIAAGVWGTINNTFDLYIDRGKPFTYLIKIWATENQNYTSGQSSTFSEHIIMGYNELSGNVVIQNVVNLNNNTLGSNGPLVKTFTGNGNNLIINYSGYAGMTGYVIAKAERFGI